MVARLLAPTGQNNDQSTAIASHSTSIEIEQPGM